MARTRPSLVVAAVCIAVFCLAMFTISKFNDAGGQAQQAATQSHYVAPASPPPLAVTEAAPTSGSPSPSSSARGTAPKLEQVPAPADTNSMSLYIRSSKVGIIPAKPALAPAPVGAMDAKSNVLTVPPEPSGCPEDYNPKDPPPNPACDWSRTTVRIRQAAYPSYPSKGTTYVYGHACSHHICSFSAIQHHSDGSFTVNPGDQIVVGTPTGILTYRVTIVRSGVKRALGSLPKFASDSTVANRIVIVTCDEANDGLNIVISAKLVSATARSKG